MLDVEQWDINWARECKNPPDERGRLAAAQRAGSAGSSQASSSVRTGFFVQSGSTSSDFAIAPSFYATAENGVNCSVITAYSWKYFEEDFCKLTLS